MNTSDESLLEILHQPSVEQLEQSRQRIVNAVMKKSSVSPKRPSYEWLVLFIVAILASTIIFFGLGYEHGFVAGKDRQAQEQHLNYLSGLRDGVRYSRRRTVATVDRDGVCSYLTRICNESPNYSYRRKEH